MSEKIISEYQSELDKHFKKHKCIKLGSIIRDGKRGELINRGTLVLMPFSNGAIQLKILDVDTVDKGFSIPLRLNTQADDYSISPEYLFWYINHDFVVKYLLNFVKGSALPRISKKDLLTLMIPIPKKNFTNKIQNDTLNMKLNNDPFRELIGLYYKDYRLNIKNKRYQTSFILAGAITEAILYQLLVESGVDRKMLEQENNLTLGKLIQYIKLLKLDSNLSLPMSSIYELQKKRNNAVHVNLAMKKKIEYTERDQICFDEIVRYFGI